MSDFSLKLESRKLHIAMATELKLMRDARGFTMRDLATTLEQPHSLVSKIEQQGRRIDVGEFIHYCRALGFDPATKLKAILEKSNISKLP